MIHSRRTGSAINVHRTKFDCPQPRLPECSPRLDQFGKWHGRSAPFILALAGIATAACGGWAGPAVAQESTADGAVTSGLAQLGVVPPEIQGLTPLAATDLSQAPDGAKPDTLLLAQANSSNSSGAPLIPITTPNPVTNPFAAADDLKIR